MSARNIVGGLTGAAFWAAKKPLETTAQAVGLARGVVSTGAAAAEGLAHHAADRMRRRHVAGAPSQPAEESSSAEPEESSSGAQADPSNPEPTDAEAPQELAEAKAEPAAKKAAKQAPAKKAAPSEQPVDDGPQIVLREPAPPVEPPIDIVGQVLQAEAEEAGHGGHAGRAGEPRGASRDEEHGDAALQRAEADEIAEELAEALPGGDVDVETPVGTTGAGVGFNPDTAEAGLQQPQTQPLVDPALTKQVKAAQRTGEAARATPKK